MCSLLGPFTRKYVACPSVILVLVNCLDTAVVVILETKCTLLKISMTFVRDASYRNACTGMADSMSSFPVTRNMFPFSSVAFHATQLAFSFWAGEALQFRRQMHMVC